MTKFEINPFVALSYGEAVKSLRGESGMRGRCLTLAGKRRAREPKRVKQGPGKGQVCVFGTGFVKYLPFCDESIL